MTARKLKTAPVAPVRPLTPGERLAWRMGLLAGYEMAASAVATERIRIAARSMEVRTPKFWPTRGGS